MCQALWHGWGCLGQENIPVLLLPGACILGNVQSRAREAAGTEPGARKAQKVSTDITPTLSPFTGPPPPPAHTHPALLAIQVGRSVWL